MTKKKRNRLATKGHFTRVTVHWLNDSISIGIALRIKLDK